MASTNEIDIPGNEVEVSENIRVAVRYRGSNPLEMEAKSKESVRVDLATNQVVVSETSKEPSIFAFDAVFNSSFSQKDIFRQEVQPLVDAVMQGYNATVLAYGQSGSGKTFTMTGDLTEASLYGIIPQAVEHLFSHSSAVPSNPQRKVTVKVTFFEVNSKTARDLLVGDAEATLEVRQDPRGHFFAKGAVTVEVSTYEECMRLLREGLARGDAQSHSFFLITVEQLTFDQDPTSPVKTSSQLTLVELASAGTRREGNEKEDKHRTLLWLSSLGTVVDVLLRGGPHMYRSSMLTMLLKDTLGGNSKSLMIAHVDPSEENVSETLSTLRFAARVRQIKNRPVKDLSGTS